MSLFGRSGKRATREEVWVCKSLPHSRQRSELISSAHDGAHEICISAINSSTQCDRKLLLGKVIHTNRTVWSNLLPPRWLVPVSAEVWGARISLQQSARDCCPKLATLQLSAFLWTLQEISTEIQEISNVKSSLLPFWTLSSDENTVSQVKGRLCKLFFWKNTIEVCIACNLV